MSHAFSVGVFLNILHGTEAEVRPQVEHIRSLAGVGHIEIWREANTLEPSVEEIIKELATQYKIIIHAPFINVSLSGHVRLVQAAVELLQEYYNWGLEMGAHVFTIHGGHKPFFQEVETDITAIANSLKNFKVSPALRCTLEHMPVAKHFSTNPNSIMSLVELKQVVDLLPNFGFTVDIGHVIQNEENWEEWMTQNLDRVYDIHFHDAFLGGKAHLPLGTADFKCMEFFEFLDKHHYKNFLSLEVIGAAAVSDSWQYLKQNGLIA